MRIKHRYFTPLIFALFMTIGGVYSQIEKKSSGGSVDTTGTPVDNQLAIWTDADTLEGDTDLTFTGLALVLGDDAEEDYQINWLGNAVDFYECLDDTADSYIIGLGTTCGTNPAITVIGDGTEDVTLAGDLTVSGTGPHAWGGSVSGWIRQYVSGAFTSDGSSNGFSGFYVDGTLTGANGDTGSHVGSTFTNRITTQSNSETVTMASQVRVVEPVITAGTDTITSSAMLWLDGVAATEATNDYGLLIDTANVRFGAVGTNDGHVHILSPATGTAVAIFESPASTTSQNLEFHYNGSRAGFIETKAAARSFKFDTVDLGNDVAGPQIVINRNSNASSASAGFIGLADRGNQQYNVWADDTGDLRIGTTIPIGSQDTSGTVVGTQTSPKVLKDILYTYSLTPDDKAYEKFQAVLNTPIYDFKFKDSWEKHPGEKFTGIAIDNGENPWYGMDPVRVTNDIAPYGTAKALNELSIPGYLILSVKVLNKKIEDLEEEISQLRSSRNLRSVAGGLQ